MDKPQESDFKNSYKFENVEIFKNQELGHGSYGAVYKAKCDALPCAAKLIYPVLFGSNHKDALAQEVPPQGKEHRQPMRRFEAECHFLSQIKHPNIVQYLGMYCDPETNAPVLLMELMDESLTHFLEIPQNIVLFQIQVNILHDTALALAFLHTNGITHRDLSSNNVLLIAGSRAKVTDFGMSTLSDAAAPNLASLTQCPGTPAYMPPEALDEPPVYSEKLDCFSFGVLTIQTITQKFPEPANQYQHRELFDSQGRRIQARVIINELERRQSHISLIPAAHPLLPIAFDCLKDRDIERPTARQLCERLEELKTTPLYASSVQQIRDREQVSAETQGETLQEKEKQLQEQTIQDQQQSIRDKESQLSRVEQEVSQLRQEIQKKTQENQHLRRQNEQLQTQQQYQRQTIQDKDQQLRRVEEDNLRLRQEVQAKCQENKKLQRQIDQLPTKQQVQQFDQAQQEKLRLKQQIWSGEEMVAELKQEMTDKDKQIQQLQTQLQQLELKSGQEIQQPRRRKFFTLPWRSKRRSKSGPSNGDNEPVLKKEQEVIDKEQNPTSVPDNLTMSPPAAASSDVGVIPIPIAAFSDHVKGMHNDGDKGFDKEYESIIMNSQEPTASCEVARLPMNKPKSRFVNTIPYDFSRVKLQEISGVDGSDYINASYIDGHGRANAYIAAQGPMPNTTGDFWRMIFEYKLNTIVMLTKCMEGGKRKCEQYWLDNFGDVYTPPNTSLKVLTIEKRPFADYNITTFRVTDSLKPDTQPHQVTHYHFLGWPDHGVPTFATSMIEFIHHVRRTHKKSGPPMLVHCSGGVGRTGVFILLDSMLERLMTEDSVNVYEFLRNMRAKRMNMVHTLAQYVFIHDALDELITCGDTSISAMEMGHKTFGLKKVIQGRTCTGFDEQFTLLNEVSRKPNDSDCSDGLQDYNQLKNRYHDKVPYNSSRVHLQSTGVTGGDYINASFVNGYKLRKAYVAAQAPMENTTNDFWRMIWDFKSKVIVMLCDTHENGQETSYVYWPSAEGTPVTYENLIVTLLSEQETGDLVTRRFEIKDGKSQSSTSSFVVTQFHYPQWPEHGRPQDTALILHLLGSSLKVQRSTGNKPITVLCNDGMGRTGAFICIHSQYERINAEGVVDFFQFIKSIRIHRPQLVSEQAHYIFCHEVLIDHIDSFDQYNNFN